MKWQVLKVLELVGRNSGTKRLLLVKEYNEERTTCVLYCPDVLHRIPCPKTLTTIQLFKQSIALFSFDWLDCRGLHLVSSVFNFMTP
jgi:hypothetical protein